MFTIKSLRNIPFEILFDTFREAFKDYEVQLEKKELGKMLQRRGFNQELSFGAFDGDQLVAFTFNGIGNFGKVKTAYDTGTGTIEEYRGQGLAKRIFEYSLPFLREAGVKQYLLEVLQHNEKAVRLYQNLGFEIIREFHYLIQNIDSVYLKRKPLKKEYTLKPVSIPIALGKEGFSDILSSWQNSPESIQRSLSDFKANAFFFYDEMVAFCIYEVASGDITQLAVSPKHRRLGLGTNLLIKTIEDIKKGELKVINIPLEESGIIEFLSSAHIHSSGQQYEMIKKL